MRAEDWRKYQNRLSIKIDRILSERGWDVTIPKTKENLLPLFKHLTVVVNSFLESKSEDKLFIKVPVEEVGLKRGRNTDDKNQIDAYNLLTGTILGCLATATSREFKAKLRPKFECYTDLQGYEKDDCFCCVQKDPSSSKPICSYIKEDNGVLRLSFVDFTHPRKTFEMCDKDSFIYIAKPPEEECTEKFVTKFTRKFTETQKEARLVDSLPSLDESYGSATLIAAYNPCNDCIPGLGSYLNVPYKHIKRYESKGLSREILVLVGDKVYSNSLQSIYNAGIKKCIFIGPEFPDYDRFKPKCYELSHRELYRSITPEVSFVDPKSVELDFPWLQDARKKLEEVLAKYDDLDSKIKTRIIHYALAPMCNPNFDQESLRRIQEVNVWGWLYDIVGGEPDEDLEYDIESWLAALSFDEQVNPKRLWCDENQRELYLEFSGWSVPKRETKKVCGHSNSFVVGVYWGSSKSISSSPLEYILRHQVAPKISVLFYKGIEDLRCRTFKTYIANEERVYTSELRDKWTLSWKSVFPTSNFAPAKLDDDLVELQEVWYKSNMAVSEAQEFEVIRTSGEKVSLRGEILLYDEDDELWGEYSLREDLLSKSKSCRIKYYQQPQSFVALMEDKDVERYSGKWKDAFRNEFLTRFSSVAGAKEESVLEDLRKEIGLTNQSLKSYAKGNSQNKFLRSKKGMRAMCNWLKSKGRISDSDVEAILQARRIYNSENIVLGKNLKSDLFEYILTGKTPERLRLLLESKRISIESLMKEAIVEVEIKEIKKKYDRDK